MLNTLNTDPTHAKETTQKLPRT